MSNHRPTAGEIIDARFAPSRLLPGAVRWDPDGPSHVATMRGVDGSDVEMALPRRLRRRLKRLKRG